MLAYLPIILKLVNIIPIIQAALQQGGSTIAIIQRLAPELLPLLQEIGGSVFPQADPAKAIQAGIDVIFDKDGTMWVQNTLNQFNKNTALDVDGSYGALTKAAVAAYQTAHPPLKVDGWCGPKTSGSLAVAVAKIAA